MPKEISMTQYVKHDRKKIVYLKIKIKIYWQKKVETKSKEQKNIFNNFQMHKVYANMNNAFRI